MTNKDDLVIKAHPLGPLAVVCASSNLCPPDLRGKPQDVLWVMIKGDEIHIPPIQAICSINIRGGKTMMAADMTVALCLGRSEVCAEFRCIETTDERATYIARRKSDTEPTKLTFTIEQARRANLTKSATWNAYPEAMLRARCSAALARIVFPDLVAGIYDPDELAHPIEQPKPAAVVEQPVAVIEPDTRTGLTGELLGLGDDVPDFVEQLLARDGVDIGTAPLNRLRGAVSYLTTNRGREALAKWRAERDAALDAAVEYETSTEEVE